MRLGKKRSGRERQMRYPARRMSDANHEPMPSRAGEVAFSVGLGAVMPLIALALTWGAFFEKGHESQSLGAPGYLLLAVVWALAVAPFVALVRVPRVARLAGWISGAAGVAFGLFFVSVVLREIWMRPPGAPIPPGRATFLALFVLVFVLGIALLLSARRGPPSERASVGIVALWPLMLVVKSPLAALVVFATTTGILYLGERAGARYGHPLAGCSAATALLVTLLAAPALWRAAKGR
jgi:hypothetical protein